MPGRGHTWTGSIRTLGAAGAPRAGLVAVLFLVALVVRAGAVGTVIGWSTPPWVEPASDARIHEDLAQNLIDGAGFGTAGRPTATTPPLYPLLLAGIYKITDHSFAAVRLVQAVLGAGTSVLLVYTVWQIYPGWTAILAGAGLAAHPLAVYLSGLTLSETVFLFWLSMVLFVAIRLRARASIPRAVALGVLTGLASLTRATFLAFVPLLLGWTYATIAGDAQVRRSIVMATALTAVMVITPWTIRNYVVYGEIIPIQSNGGLVFWAGNNPFADGGMVMPSPATWRAGEVPDGPDYSWNGLSNAESNRRYTSAAFDWIRSNPGDFGRTVLRKLSRLYGFSRAGIGTAFSIPPIIGAVNILFLGFAAIGALLSLPQWRQTGLLHMLILYQTCAVILFSGGTRYQASMLPSLTTFAAVAAVTGTKALSHYRSALRAGTGLDILKV